MVCLFSSTFDISIPACSLVHRCVPPIFGSFSWPRFPVFMMSLFSQPPRLFTLTGLAEELYLVFIACIERLLCRAAEYILVEFLGT